MGKSVKSRLAKVEATLKKEKPEMKTVDIKTAVGNTLGTDYVGIGGIITNPAAPGNTINYDLTRGFQQGLLNDDANLVGNYCDLQSIDCRVFLQFTTASGNVSASQFKSVRLMLIRMPAANVMTPNDVIAQILEYGDGATYGDMALCSPYKRNTSLNGGYDVLWDKVVTLTNPVANSTAGGNGFGNPTKSFRFLRFRKKWARGLKLRFAGVSPLMTVEQNRLLLFCYTPGEQLVVPALADDHVSISFNSRIRYTDE